MENNVEGVLKRLDMELPHDPAIIFMTIHSKNGNTKKKRSRNPNVHNNIIYNSQDVKATQVSINKWMG